MSSQKPAVALVAAMMVMVLFGSVHSFSVFLAPLEVILEADRSSVSLFYSFALVFLTATVLVGHRGYHLIRPAWMLFWVSVVASLGLWMTSLATSWWVVFIGYSIVFGSVNGIGYGYALQLMGRVYADRAGFAMGAVTAAYGLGSIVFSFVFARFLIRDGFSATLEMMTVCVLLIGILSTAMIALSRVRYDDQQRDIASPPGIWSIGRYWVCYFFSIFSGLMVIGHAAGVVGVVDSDPSMTFWGAVVVGIGSTIGGFAAGWLVDRWSMTTFLLGLPLLSAAGLLSLLFVSDVGWVIGLLSLIGLGYGAMITVYPVAINRQHGARNGPAVYGWVFTGWGLAGLAAPWCAGWLYDQFAHYQFAIGVACATALLAAISVRVTGTGKRDAY